MSLANALVSLSHWLRDHEIEVTASQLSAAHQLLHQRGIELTAADFPEAIPFLRALFAKNPADQRRFEELVQQWQVLFAGGAEIDKTATENNHGSHSDTVKLPPTQPKRLTFLLLFAIICAVGVRVGQMELLVFQAKQGAEGRPLQAVDITAGSCVLLTGPDGRATCQLPWYRLDSIARARVPGQEIETKIARLERLWGEETIIEFRFEDFPLTKLNEEPIVDDELNMLEVISRREIPTPERVLTNERQSNDVVQVRLLTGIGWFSFFLLVFNLWLWFTMRLSRGLQPMVDRVEALHGATGNIRLKIMRDMRRVAGAMRNQVSFESMRLNMHSTTNETLRAGGLFKPVFTSRRERRFVFLIESRNIHDHHARIGLDLAEQCRRMGVNAHIYTFAGDIAVLQDVKPSTSSKRKLVQHYIRFDELLGAASASEFIFICDPRVLVANFRSKLLHWSERIQGESLGCKVLTMTSSGQTIRARAILASSRISVLPVRKESLKILGDSSIWPKAFAEGVPVFDYVGPGLSDTEIPPASDAVSKLTSALAVHLGSDGYLWLQACALYPEVNWAVTNALGQFLVSSDRRETILLQLSGLVWFRTARFPDWLRLALVGKIPRRSLVKLRRFYWGLFLSSTGHEVFTLKVHWSRLKLLVAAENGPILSERVYARFLLGSRPSPLDLPAPKRLWRNLMNAPNTTPLLATSTAAILSASIAILLHPEATPAESDKVQPWDVAVGTDPAQVILAWSSNNQIEVASLSLETGATWRRFTKVVPSPAVARLAPNGIILAEIDGTARATLWNVGIDVPQLTLRGESGLGLPSSGTSSSQLVAFSPTGSSVVQLSQQGVTAAILREDEKHETRTGGGFDAAFVRQATMLGINDAGSLAFVAGADEMRILPLLSPSEQSVTAASSIFSERMISEQRVVSAPDGDPRKALAIHQRGRGYTECFQSGRVVSALREIRTEPKNLDRAIERTYASYSHSQITVSSCTALTTHPSSNFEAVGQRDGSVIIFYSRNARERLQLSAPYGSNSPVRKLVFSKSGEYLAVAREDNSLSLVQFMLTGLPSHMDGPRHFDEE